MSYEKQCYYCSFRYDHEGSPMCPSCGRGKPRRPGMPFTKAELERAEKEWRESMGTTGCSPTNIASFARMCGPKKRDEE
jgi:hypothetical protein